MATKTKEAPQAAAKATADPRPLMRFRLLAGKHVDENGVLHNARDPKTCVFESRVDCVARFGANKFALMQPGEVAPPLAPLAHEPNDGLDDMTLEELQQMAGDESIDVAGDDKPAVMAKLRKAFGDNE